ncbi:hypothetical protein XarjCFBP7653_04620 [Xanthomonas arboricola]|nr:hypothetical protein XarjCFBP7653_04620 [Xanthomonas arboricola]
MAAAFFDIFRVLSLVASVSAHVACPGRHPWALLPKPAMLTDLINAAGFTDTGVPIEGRDAMPLLHEFLRWRD